VAANQPHSTASCAVITANLEDPSVHTADAVALEMHQTVRAHVAMHHTGSMKRAWEMVARRYGLTSRRVRAYWGGEVRKVPAHEADAIRAARRAIIRERQRLLDHEQEMLQMRLAELEAE